MFAIQLVLYLISANIVQMRYDTSYFKVLSEFLHHFCCVRDNSYPGHLGRCTCNGSRCVGGLGRQQLGVERRERSV